MGFHPVISNNQSRLTQLASLTTKDFKYLLKLSLVLTDKKEAKERYLQLLLQATPNLPGLQQKH